MKKLFLFLIVAVTITGCRSIYLSELQPTTRYTPEFLPPLRPYFDVASFETVFASDISNTSSYGSASAFNVNGTTMAFGGASSTTETYRNPMLNQLKNIFVNDVNANICQKYGQTKGSIVCRVITGSHGKRTGMWWLGAYPFLGIPYLLGMPAKAAKTFLKIQVDIYDAENNLVGSYVSPYIKDKKYVALYWGYSGSNSLTKSAWNAFKKCMDDIKIQIAQDFDRLNEALK